MYTVVGKAIEVCRMGGRQKGEIDVVIDFMRVGKRGCVCLEDEDEDKGNRGRWP